MFIGSAGAIGSLVIWVVKRLINILGEEMKATREAFTEALEKLRKHDAIERAEDRDNFAKTLRTILRIQSGTPVESTADHPAATGNRDGG